MSDFFKVGDRVILMRTSDRYIFGEYTAGTVCESDGMYLSVRMDCSKKHKPCWFLGKRFDRMLLSPKDHLFVYGKDR